MTDWRDKLKELLKGRSVGQDEPQRQTPQDQSVTSQPAHVAKARPTQRYLCLGLDFGTSSTKAVVRLLPSGPAFAVPVGTGGTAAEPYLAPTRLWITGDGNAALTLGGEGAWVEDLKVRLMERPWHSIPAAAGIGVQARPVDLAAAYLCLILRGIFAWVKKEILPSLGSVQISWSMNVGIPARDFDAREIKEAFLTAAKAGWHMAAEGGTVDVRRTAKVVSDARNSAFIPNDIAAEMIEVVPEVAAGVTAYARSPERQGGVHFFVDIGATTLDSSVFLLNETADGLKYVFLSADVDDKLGALRLHRYRASELGRLALARFAASDPLKPIPERAKDCVPTDAEISEIDSDFSERCIQKVCSVVAKAKKKAQADMSVPDDRPSDPILVLPSGGGIHLPLYKEAISRAGNRVGPGGGLGLRVKPFQMRPVPKPAELRPAGLTQETWQRLAVAYGLSFSFEDIGEFVPPSAVDDLPLPQRGHDDGDSFISKDQV